MSDNGWMIFNMVKEKKHGLMELYMKAITKMEKKKD